MKKSQPLVSVYTCVFNMADKLPRALSSVLNLTYENIEHVIIDDGSTDNLKEIIDSYLKTVSGRYPVIFKSKPNGGKYTALNLANSLMNGYFAIQLDADDELLPDSIEYLVNQYELIPSDKKDEYWCVQGRCISSLSNKMVGDAYPENINVNTKEAYNIAGKIKGEKIGLQKTHILKQYKFPEPKGVNFIPEGYVFSQINNIYGTWFTNHLCRVYYESTAGGAQLSSKGVRTKQRFSNNCWAAKWRLETKQQPFFTKIKALTFYSIFYHLSLDEYKCNNKYFFKSNLYNIYLSTIYLFTFFIAFILKKKWGIKY